MHVLIADNGWMSEVKHDIFLSEPWLANFQQTIATKDSIVLKLKQKIKRLKSQVQALEIVVERSQVVIRRQEDMLDKATNQITVRKVATNNLQVRFRGVKLLSDDNAWIYKSVLWVESFERDAWFCNLESGPNKCKRSCIWNAIYGSEVYTFGGQSQISYIKMKKGVCIDLDISATTFAR